jgi:hypothetical protein
MFTLVQGKLFDKFSNYTITAGDIGASPAMHQHAINKIGDLNLALYSDGNHTHTMVASITSGETQLKDKVDLTFAGNITATREGNVITLTKPVIKTDKVSVLGSGELNTAFYLGAANTDKDSPAEKHLLLVEDY